MIRPRVSTMIQPEVTPRRWVVSELDPKAFAAGPKNLYVYTGNGPLNATDPNGETQQAGSTSTLPGYTFQKTTVPNPPGQADDDFPFQNPTPSQTSVQKLANEQTGYGTMVSEQYQLMCNSKAAPGCDPIEYDFNGCLDRCCTWPRHRRLGYRLNLV